MPKQGTKNPLAGMPARGSDPATDATALTPDNSNDLAAPSRSLYVGVTGDLTVVMADAHDGTTVLFKAVPVGTIPLGIKRLMATGTTATNVVALF